MYAFTEKVSSNNPSKIGWDFVRLGFCPVGILSVGVLSAGILSVGILSVGILSCPPEYSHRQKNEQTRPPSIANSVADFD